MNFFAFNQKGECLMAYPVNPPDDRRITATAMAKLFEQYEIDRYVVVAECWMGSLEGGKYGIRPRLDPDRREAISVIAVDSSGGVASGFFAIDRADDGTGSVGEWTDSNDIGGWPTSLLQDQDSLDWRKIHDGRKLH
jgi:hypothetical protein